jgi:hypothetical protein
MGRWSSWWLLLGANPAQPEKGLEVKLYGMGEKEGNGCVGMGHLRP